MTWEVREGDCLTLLRQMPSQSVQCCVTSPPYWGLRDYGHDGQMGLESTPEEYVAGMVEVFSEVRRVLRDDGTLWLNIGDSYAGGGRAGNNPEYMGKHTMFGKSGWDPGVFGKPQPVPRGLKAKDLVGIPWRLAFALQADGWYLRADIIWSKPNPMPESVRDRPTKAHEYVFFLSKSAKYYFDQDAVREESITGDTRRPYGSQGAWDLDGRSEDQKHGGEQRQDPATGRNIRSVWNIATRPYKGAHFAVMPLALVEPCVKAGAPEGSTVLDPFSGAGTVGFVAHQLGRSFIGCELNPDYAAMSRERISALDFSEAERLFIERVIDV